MQVFQDLGSLIEQRWRDEDYCEEVFPEIAEQALIEMTPRRQVSPWDIIRWVGTSTELPQQQDVVGAFGNPPITLYNGPRFYIDIYYWLDGTTSIHQHSFSGAFQVFSGSSLHSRYDFEEKRKVNAHFSVGQITLNSVELLKEDDVRRIVPGRPHSTLCFILIVLRPRLLSERAALPAPSRSMIITSLTSRQTRFTSHLSCSKSSRALPFF